LREELIGKSIIQLELTGIDRNKFIVLFSERGRRCGRVIFTADNTVLHTLHLLFCGFLAGPQLFSGLLNPAVDCDKSLEELTSDSK
jgi:hypothetical protein